MTILVTGATGLIGSALLGELASRGERPRAACRRPEKARDALAAGADPVIVDFDDPQTLGPALAGIDTLFLLGATGPHQAEHEIAVVKAASPSGATRIVKLSVWRAPDQLSPFARLHRRVELEIEASRLEWTFLRPCGFMQTLIDRQAESIRTRRVLAQPRMNGAAGYIDARDIARVAARVLTEEGHLRRAYALSGPTALTYLTSRGSSARCSDTSSDTSSCLMSRQRTTCGRRARLPSWSST